MVRSASLAPDEIALVGRLAEQLAGGSFTELIRRLLRVLAEPLSRRLDELVEAGMDPHERLILLNPPTLTTDAEIQAFYGSSTWPEQAPERPPSY